MENQSPDTQNETSQKLLTRKEAVFLILLVISLIFNLFLIYNTGYLNNDVGVNSLSQQNNSEQQSTESIYQLANFDTTELLPGDQDINSIYYLDGKPVYFQINKDNKIDIYHGDKLVKTTNLESGNWPKIIAVHQDPDYILLTTKPLGDIEGVPIFEGEISLTKINVADNWKLIELTDGATIVTDINTTIGKAVGVSSKKSGQQLVIFDLINQTPQYVPIDTKYASAGNAKISADGKGVAYVAATGNLEESTSAIYFYDVNKNTTQLYRPDSKGLYEINNVSTFAPYTINYSLPESFTTR